MRSMWTYAPEDFQTQSKTVQKHVAILFIFNKAE